MPLPSTARVASNVLTAPRQAIRLAREAHLGPQLARSRRFVTQSHALSTPMARPRSLFIAATIAVALYLLGRRLSD